MNGQQLPKNRLHVCTRSEEVDAFLVVADGSESDAVPVIPTALAETYWAHPSNRHAAEAS